MSSPGDSPLPPGQALVLDLFDMGALKANPMVRWLVHTAAAACRLDGRGPAEIAPGLVAHHGWTGVAIVVSGGVERLCELAGEVQDGAPAACLRVLDMLAAHSLTWDREDCWGSCTLVRFSVHPDEVVVEMSAPLLPGWWTECGPTPDGSPG